MIAEEPAEQVSHCPVPGLERSGRCLFNRPLYGSPPPFVTFGGDLPVFALSTVYHGGKLGNLFLVVLSEEGSFAAQESKHVSSCYDGLSLSHEIRDPRIGDGVLRLRVYPGRAVAGCLAHLTAENLPPGTTVAWVYGGASGKYDFKYPGEVTILHLSPEDRQGNTIDLTKNGFVLRGMAITPKKHVAIPDSDVPHPPISRVTVEPLGKTELVEGALDAEEASPGAGRLGRVEAIRGGGNGESFLRIVEGDRPRAASIRDDIRASLEEGGLLLDSFRLHTPDSELDLVARLAIPAYRAAWWDAGGVRVHLHGATAWAAPYLGWRGLYGAIVLGWHDLIRDTFRAYRTRQIREGEHEGAYPALYHQPGMRVYTMDEVFVHELFHYYSWSGDSEFVQEMWESVEKNLRFRKRMLDPDGDGLYTNVLNTWVSDYHWYLGGKCTQSSAYHYHAFAKMAETAPLAGRDPAPFAAEARKISEAIERELWLDDQGVYAEYKDTIGLERVHRAVELASVYHPIEVGIPGPLRAARMVAFVEHTFEHVPTSGGGVVPYSAPWRPTPPTGILHSSRARCPNEALHMALAAYQAGSDDYANRILRGVCDSALTSVTAPGSLCNWVDAEGRGNKHPDFSDCTSLIFRTIAEGLFGIEPAVDGEAVRFTPRLPRTWDRASLSTAGFAVTFERSGMSDQYTFESEKRLRYDVRVPMRYDRIEAVEVDGERADHALELEAGVPRILFRSPAPGTCSLRVVVRYTEGAAAAKAADVETHSLEAFVCPPSPSDAPAAAADLEPMLYDLGPYRNRDLEKVFLQEYSSSEMADLHWGDVNGWRMVRRDSLSVWDRISQEPDLSTLRARVDGTGRIVSPDTETLIQFQVSTGPKNTVLLGRWDELPDTVRFPIETPRVRAVYLLVAGTTFPMQSHIANARVVLHYDDASSEPTDLINPYNYDDGIGSFGDYHYSENEMVELGKKTHADVIALRTDPRKQLTAVEVCCLSNQILFGVLGLTLLRDRQACRGNAVDRISTVPDHG